MCLFPLYIPRKNPVRSDKLSAIQFKRPSGGFSSYYVMRCHGDDFLYKFQRVNCGHCIECVKSRQNSLACRIMRTAEAFGSMFFVTLTYRPGELPLAAVLEQIDKETGEVFIAQKLNHIYRDELANFECQLQTGAIRSAYRPFCEDDEYIYRVRVTPTLDSRDTNLWLKSARVAYKREFHVPLPRFKYCLVGEYGSKSNRPHYHACFFGLSSHDVHWLVSRWQYGFTYVQQVNRINEDGSDGFLAASKYVGKYVSKGVYESRFVKDGSSAKMRICSSKQLGETLSPALVSYFRCEDMFDIDVHKELPYDVLPRFIDEYKKRNFFVFGKYKFLLPLYFKHLIWYEKNCDNVFVSTPLWRQITRALEVDDVRVYGEKLIKDNPAISPGEFKHKIIEFQNNLELLALSKDYHGNLRLQEFYLKSNF